MKLFQQLLVAGTAVGLFAPIAAQASETMNLEDMNSYVRKSSKSQRFDNKTFINEVSEELATLKGRVDGLEANQNNLEAGGIKPNLNQTLTVQVFLFPDPLKLFVKLSELPSLNLNELATSYPVSFMEFVPGISNDIRQPLLEILLKVLFEFHLLVVCIRIMLLVHQQWYKHLFEFPSRLTLLLHLL